MHHIQHCAKSKQLFGEEGKDYHLWFDQYFKIFGYDHRRILHTKEGLIIAVRIFGPNCRKHLVQHLKDDHCKYTGD